MFLYQFLWLSLIAGHVSHFASALDADGWRKQTIYQLLTDRFARDDDLNAPCNLPLRQYCGGTWRGLMTKLDYIQGMGFSAVWISPIVENEDDGYHGYYTLDHDKLNLNFGTADDLKALSDALHERGMYLMVDVVVNHVGSPRWREFHPDARYGALSEPEDYHPHCWIPNYDNQTVVEQCWIGEDQREALVDVNTESPKVVREMYRWIKQLVSDYGVDGLRVDTVKHVRKSFWPEFEKASGVFCTDPAYTYAYQGEALSSVHNYPLFFPLRRAFSSPQAEMIELTDMILRAQAEAEDVTTLTTFLDNHDLPRFAHTVADKSLRMNAMAFPFLADGIPIMYSGCEHGFEGGDDPYNREPMWKARWETKDFFYVLISRLVAARQTALAADIAYETAISVPIVTTDHEIVIHRRPLLSVLSNRGVTGRDSIIAFTVPELKAGTILVDIVPEGDINDSANHVLVGIGGSVRVRISKGKPRVFMTYQLATTFQTIYSTNIKHALKNEELLPVAVKNSASLSRTLPSTPRRRFRHSFSSFWRSPSKKTETQVGVLTNCWRTLIAVAYTPLVNTLRIVQSSG